MPKLPGINHRRAVLALQKAGFRIVREGRKHIVMSDGSRFLTIPRNDPVNSYTMDEGILEATIEFCALMGGH